MNRGVPMFLVKRNENHTIIFYTWFLATGAGEYKIYNGKKYPYGKVGIYSSYEYNDSYYIKENNIYDILIMEQGFNPTGVVAYIDQNGIQWIYSNFKLVQKINLVTGEALEVNEIYLLSNPGNLNPKIRQRIED